MTWRQRVALLLIAVLVTSVAHTDTGAAVTAFHSASPAELVAIGQHADGRTLFVALAFGQGPIARLFPEFNNTPTLGDKAKDAIDDLTLRMESAQPGFFSSFADAMHSGDRVTIEAALRHAGGLAQGVSRKSAPASADTSCIPEQEPGCDGDVIILVALVVVIIAFITITLGPTQDPSDAIQIDMGDAPSLSREMLVDEIARTLRSS